MTRWPTKPLGNFLAQERGSVDPSRFPDEVFDLYSIPAFDTGEPEVRAGREIGSAKQTVQPRDILLSRIVPHIRRAWVVWAACGRRLIASGEWIVFRSPLVHPSYLRHFLLSDAFHARFMQTVSGVGGSLLRAKTSEVAKIHVPVPPLVEQERIVNLLDEADELRKLRTQADTRTAQLIPALFHEMFLNTKMRDIVWPKVTLSELCSRVVDCPHSTPAYSARETPFHCVRSSDIQGGKFDWSSTKTVERDEYEERIAQLEPQAGDVVFCREGARLGNAAVIPNDRRVCLGQRMMLFRLNPSISTPYFLCSLILSQPIQNKIWTLVGGSASPHLNVRDIKDFLTDLPPLALQQEFDRRVNEIRAFEAAQTASRRRTEDLFQSMLHKAFNGEL